MVSRAQIKALAMAYCKLLEAEEILEVREATFDILADKFMGEMQEHPMNEGKMWERDEAYHLTCEDCQLKAGAIALKIVDAWMAEEKD